MSEDQIIWQNAVGEWRKRKKTERNAEIARLHWEEGVAVVDLAPAFGVRAARISQIIHMPEYREMARASYERELQS